MAAAKAKRAERVSQAERRSGDTRHCTLMRTAKLVGLNGEYLCIVQDVSANGVKLRLFHGFPPERHLFLELSNGAQYAIERRWTEGQRAGFQFAAPIDVDEFIREPNPHGRRPVRLRFNRSGVLAAGDERSHAVLADLSCQGACVEAGSQFAVGRMVRLEIDGMSSRLGHVCWRRDFTHGIVFQEALSPQDLARYAHEAQPFAPDDGGLSDQQALCA